MRNTSLTVAVALAASLSSTVACVALAGQVDWTASRAESVEPGDGLRWSWPELGALSCSRWGWQSYDRVNEDGTRAGSWTTFAPRDFAVQVMGRELVEQCRLQFADGATSCSVRADDIELVLGVDGTVNLHIAPEAMGARIRSEGKLGATRAVNDTIEWYVDDEGKHPLGLKLEKLK